MRSTVIPAQVTTVEDRIAGLSISQLLLLVLPIFSGSTLFVVMPPFFSYAVYKVVLITTLAVLCLALAIRIKEKILLFWLVLLIDYALRPRYYVFDKNDSYMRDEAAQRAISPESVEMLRKKEADLLHLPQLSTAKIVEVESVITDPQASLHFKTNRKGGLNVYITEVRQ